MSEMNETSFEKTSIIDTNRYIDDEDDATKLKSVIVGTFMKLQDSYEHYLNNNIESYNISTDHQISDNYVPYSQRPETYIVPSIFALIFIVGLVGNGTLVYIFIRNKSMRNLPNTFILCLAVGDLLVIVGTVPFISLIYTIESWPFGEFICKLSEFMRDVSLGVTVLALSVLSVDRYLAICMPFHNVKDNCYKNMTIPVVIGLWTVSIAFAIPGAYNSHILTFNISDGTHINVCYPFPQHLGQWYPKLIVLLRFIIFYVIPLMAIGSLYALMARRLVISSRQVIGLNVNHYKHIALRTKVAKMVFALAIIFAICFFPNHIFMLWFYYTFPQSMDNYNSFWHILKITGYCLSFTNSCLNPVTLFLISGKFRSHFNKYLFGCFSRKRRLNRQQTYRLKATVYYSASIKSLSLGRHNTLSTKL